MRWSVAACSALIGERDTQFDVVPGGRVEPEDGAGVGTVLRGRVAQLAVVAPALQGGHRDVRGGVVVQLVRGAVERPRDEPGDRGGPVGERRRLHGRAGAAGVVVREVEDEFGVRAGGEAVPFERRARRRRHLGVNGPGVLRHRRTGPGEGAEPHLVVTGRRGLVVVAVRVRVRARGGAPVVPYGGRDDQQVAAASRAADAVEVRGGEPGDVVLVVVVPGVVAARRGHRVDLGEAVGRLGARQVVAVVAGRRHERVNEFGVVRAAGGSRGGVGDGCRRGRAAGRQRGEAEGSGEQCGNRGPHRPARPTGGPRKIHAGQGGMGSYWHVTSPASRYARTVQPLRETTLSALMPGAQPSGNTAVDTRDRTRRVHDRASLDTGKAHNGQTEFVQFARGRASACRRSWSDAVCGAGCGRGAARRGGERARMAKWAPGRRYG